MSESENALPLDDRFWEHVDHLDFKVAIGLDNGKFLNIISALRDIYDLIKSNKLEDASFFITGLAAAMVASRYGKSQDVIDEMIVKVFKDDFDKGLKELLSEKQ